MPPEQTADGRVPLPSSFAVASAARPARTNLPEACEQDSGHDRSNTKPCREVAEASIMRK